MDISSRRDYFVMVITTLSDGQSGFCLTLQVREPIQSILDVRILIFLPL